VISLILQLARLSQDSRNLPIALFRLKIELVVAENQVLKVPQHWHPQQQRHFRRRRRSNCLFSTKAAHYKVVALLKSFPKRSRKLKSDGWLLSSGPSKFKAPFTIVLLGDFKTFGTPLLILDTVKIQQSSSLQIIQKSTESSANYFTF